MLIANRGDGLDKNLPGMVEAAAVSAAAWACCKSLGMYCVAL